MNRNEEDQLTLILVGAGAVLLFGGSVLAWVFGALTVGTEAFTDWLLSNNLVVDQSQALFGIAGVGLDLPRIVLILGGLVLLVIIVSSLRRAAARKSAEKAMRMM